MFAVPRGVPPWATSGPLSPPPSFLGFLYLLLIFPLTFPSSYLTTHACFYSASWFQVLLESARLWGDQNTAWHLRVSPQSKCISTGCQSPVWVEWFSWEAVLQAVTQGSKPLPSSDVTSTGLSDREVTQGISGQAWKWCTWQWSQLYRPEPRHVVPVYLQGCLYIFLPEGAGLYLGNLNQIMLKSEYSERRKL